MGMLDEVKREIMMRHTPDAPEHQEDRPKQEQRRAKAQKPKTKEEIEAYRQRMIAKEEAAYIKKMGLDPKSGSAVAAEKREKKQKKEPKKERARDEASAGKPRRQRKCQAPAHQEQTPPKVAKELKAMEMPKMMKPLVPLYLLHIPGLPKGDGLLVCYAQGVEQ